MLRPWTDRQAMKQRPPLRSSLAVAHRLTRLAGWQGMQRRGAAEETARRAVTVACVTSFFPPCRILLISTRTAVAVRKCLRRPSRALAPVVALPLKWQRQDLPDRDVARVAISRDSDRDPLVGHVEPKRTVKEVPHGEQRGPVAVGLVFAIR